MGWLSSNLYGRVGTPDIADWVDDPGEYKRRFFEEVLAERTAWLTKQQYAQFLEFMKVDNDLTEEKAREILGKLKDDVVVAAEKIAAVLSRRGLLAGEDQDEVRRKVTNVLVNSPVLEGMGRE